MCKSKLSDIYTLGFLQTNHKSKEECSYSPNSTISRASSRFNLPTSPKLMQQTWSKSNSEEPLPFLNPAQICLERLHVAERSPGILMTTYGPWTACGVHCALSGRQHSGRCKPSCLDGSLSSHNQQAALLSLLMHWFMHLSREHSTNLAMQLAQPSE